MTSKITLPELKAEVVDNNIKGFSKLKKEEIVDLLKTNGVKIDNKIDTKIDIDIDKMSNDLKKMSVKETKKEPKETKDSKKHLKKLKNRNFG